MLSAQHSVLFVATASLVAFASSVDAKGKGSYPKISRPIVADEDGGSSSRCYDTQGNQITCTISKTEWIVIGALGAVVALIVLILVLYFAIRAKIESFASKKKTKTKDTKGVHHKVPAEEPILPLYHNEPSTYDPDQKKQAGGMAESEKPHCPTPYDPVYPSQQHDHRYSDSASIASSVYNAPPVTHARPQDYSFQDYYSTNATPQPEIHATPPPLSLHLNTDSPPRASIADALD